MATCPRCGRQLSDTIHMSLSEANRTGGQVLVRCSCGGETMYQSADYNARNARLRAQKEAEELARYNVEEHSNGYIGFAGMLALAAILVPTVAVAIRNAADDPRFWANFFSVIFLIFGFVIVCGFISFLAMKQAKYLKTADAKKIRRARGWTRVAHVFGCALYLALIGWGVSLFFLPNP